jgi:hypothetical protein
MKKIFLISVFLILYSQNIKAQTTNPPLYILFDASVPQIYCEFEKEVDRTKSDVWFQDVPPYDLYWFNKKTFDAPYSDIDAVYGGYELKLMTLDKTQYTTITSAQLSNYNVKTYDQLVEMFAPLPIDDTEAYFHNREVYVVERIKGINPTYRILRVRPHEYVKM